MKYVDLGFQVPIGINRYIMECKFLLLSFIPAKILGINRYIMECKFSSSLSLFLSAFELIDTLWNVNVRRICSYAERRPN